MFPTLLFSPRPSNKTSKILEAVVRQYIYDFDVQTYSHTPFPDTAAKAPTPDSTSTSNANDITQYNKLKSYIVRGNIELKECWAEGLKSLPYAAVQKEFPNTWSGRARDWIEPAGIWPSKFGKYRFGYLLPLHRNTQPQEVLNFGKRLMDEWMDANHVDYTSRLDDVIY